jgi:AcrR family transcriptional regulator
MAIISFKMVDTLYLRDPQQSELGQRIIRESVKMMDKIGFEDFTFRKLGEEIGSPEASIYRYFENKHRLLMYLIDWYWTWLEYRIDYNVANVKDPREKLKVCLRLLSEENKADPNIPHVDEAALQRIAVAEFEKTYLTKNVDFDNKDGVFMPYKVLCGRIAGIISEINPKFGYPRALVSTVMLSITHQLFYAEHLPSLTDIKYNPKRHRRELYDFLVNVVFKSIDR